MLNCYLKCLEISTPDVSYEHDSSLTHNSRMAYWSEQVVKMKGQLIFFFFFRSIVDDSEMYEQQKPFRLDELVRISAFLNILVFKMLWNEMVDGKTVRTRRFSDCYRRKSEKNTSPPRVFRKLQTRCILGNAIPAEAGSYPRIVEPEN